MKPHGMLKHVSLLVALATAPCGALFAANSGAGNIPGPANLQRLYDVLHAQPALAPQDVSLSLPPLPPPSANQLREDARVNLSGVEVRGVTQLKPAELAPLFETISGQETSLAAIDRVVDAITKLYRKRGYFLSRAYLPPQDMADGKLVIDVVEGRVDAVKLVANDRIQNNPMVQTIVERLRANPTPTSQEIETALLQLNDIPGTTAQGQLSPADAPGGAILTIGMEESRGSLEFGFSNYGTRYIGPNRFEFGAHVNNLIAPLGDRLDLQALQDPNDSDLTLLDGTYSLPLNSHGTSLSLHGSRGISRPEWTLEALDIESKTVDAGLTLTQNLKRTRASSWDIYGTFDWSDALTTSNHQQLSADHGRTLRLGTRATTLDSLQGFTTTDFKVSTGLDAMGSTRAYEINASRLRGTGSDFRKFNLDVSRLQRLNPTWNLLLSGAGQFSSHALLAGEEFGLGGPEGFGRGYDSNELLGDHGLAAKAELQATFPVDWPWLDAWQLFGFYDFGAVWNKDRDITEDNTAQTLASVGTGVRLQFNPNLSGEFMLAKPTTRNVQTSGDDNPTLYFRLKSKVDFETLGKLHKGRKDPS